MKRQSSLILVTLGLLSSVPTLSAQERVKQIAIKSDWLGLGDTSKTELTIQSIGPVYQLQGHQEDVPFLQEPGHRKRGPFQFSGKRVDSSLVNAIVAAVNGNVVDEPNLQNLGVTRKYLETRVRRVTTASSRYSLKSGAADQKALFRTSFTNPEFVAMVLPNLFRCCHTDDYPSVDVAMTFEDGSVVTMHSGSQGAFMLPWKLVRHGQVLSTFDARLARAIAALMPAQATNRNRIAGMELDFQLADAVMDAIEDEWKLLGAGKKP